MARIAAAQMEKIFIFDSIEPSQQKAPADGYYMELLQHRLQLPRRSSLILIKIKPGPAGSITSNRTASRSMVDGKGIAVAGTEGDAPWMGTRSSNSFGINSAPPR
jgi:hypothetical protein